MICVWSFEVATTLGENKFDKLFNTYYGFLQ